MNVKDFTQDEIDYLLKRCNFVGYEKDLFVLRAQGTTIEEIAEILEISYDYARKVSQKVNRKIIRVL